MLLYKMKNWVLSIGAIIILTSVIGIILPEGKLSKNVKSIFSLIVVLVVVQPVISLKNNSFSIETIFEEQNVFLQEDFIYYVNEQKMTNNQKLCENYLQNTGISNGKIFIEYTINQNGQALINRVIIDLQNAVINSELEHIDIIENILSYVSNVLMINKNQVIINE